MKGICQSTVATALILSFVGLARAQSPDSVVVAWGANDSGQTTVPVIAQSGVTAIAAGGYHTVVAKSDGSVVAWGNNRFGQTNVPLGLSGVTAVAAGAYHTVALKKDGTVVAWGYNLVGQTNVPAGLNGVTAIAAGIGDGHNVALKNDGSVVAWGHNNVGQTTVPLAAQGDVIAIAAGCDHTVALKSNGSVVAWGYNNLSQTSVPAAARSDVKAIAAGCAHTVALKTDGTVVAWGHNGSGQTNVPPGLSGVTAIAAGAQHTVALKKDGTVVVWGSSSGNQTPAPVGLGGVIAISAGFDYTVALLSPTRLQFAAPNYSAAENGASMILTVERRGDLSGTHTVDYITQDGSAVAGLDYTASSGTLSFSPGQTTRTFSIPILNDGVPENTETFQVLLKNLTGIEAHLGVPVTGTVKILDNDTGIQFSAAHYTFLEKDGVARITVLQGDDMNREVTVDYATSGGTAVAGEDYSSQSGTLHFAPGQSTQSIFIRILNDELNEGSEDLHLTLTNRSAGISLGRNQEAVLAILDDERPLAIVKSIAAAEGQTLALKSDGSLWTWGNDGVEIRTVPLRIGTDNDWTAVVAGRFHFVGLKANGTLWIWGESVCHTNCNRPARIDADNDWKAIAAGPYSTLALKTDGSLWAWNYAWKNTGPIRVGADNDWMTVAVGWDGLALKMDGSLWQVDWPDWQETGLVMKRVGIDHDWIQITGGSHGQYELFPHNLALKSNGSLWGWRYNDGGQIGDGTTDFRPLPVPITTHRDWVVVSAGLEHSVALKADGSLWTWGGNRGGELGIGSLQGTNRPVRVGLDTDWVAAVAGYLRTVALKADGSLWAWGGNGTLTDTHVPARIGTDNDWAVPALLASEFRVTSQAAIANGIFRLSFSHTNSFSYFILYRGTEATSIHQPIDATLGPFVFQLSDRMPVASNATLFYRVRAVPLAQPLDLDGDGIDDGYEPRHRSFLDPFNESDATLDSDGDGSSNLQEYREGTDPVLPPPLLRNPVHEPS